MSEEPTGTAPAERRSINVTVPLTPGAHERLRELAHIHRSSLAQEGVVAIETHLERHEAPISRPIKDGE